MTAHACAKLGRMRYIVIGAGAVGGAVGGRLAQAGREVVLVARGRHLAALGEHGLRLRVPEGESTHRLPAVEGPGPLGELRSDDVLLLAVKTQDTVAALETWADVPVAGGGTAAERLPLVCLQNGVESGRPGPPCWTAGSAWSWRRTGGRARCRPSRSAGTAGSPGSRSSRSPSDCGRRGSGSWTAVTERASARRMGQGNKRGLGRDAVPLAD